MSFSKHANNKANNIYVMGKDYIQKIMILQYTQKKCFIETLRTQVNNSYLFVNGREELKFKTKTDQMINKNLCLGNLSHDWTRDQSTKTSLYGNIYDFVVNYKAISGTTTIYDMHRYLMTKHDIKS